MGKSVQFKLPAGVGKVKVGTLNQNRAASELP